MLGYQPGAQDAAGMGSKLANAGGHELLQTRPHLEWIKNVKVVSNKEVL